MTIQEAKSFVGSQLNLKWTTRNGESSDVVFVVSVGFVPLYGPCLITDVGEISLDRVLDYACIEERKAS